MSATTAYNRGRKKKVNWLSCKWCECDSSTQRETCIVGVWRVLKKRSIVEENVATIDKERKKVRYEKKWMPIMTLIGGSTSLVSQCSPSWDEGSILQIYIRKSHLKRYCDGKWCLNLEGNYLQEAFKKPELCFTQRRMEEERTCWRSFFILHWKWNFWEIHSGFSAGGKRDRRRCTEWM